VLVRPYKEMLHWWNRYKDIPEEGKNLDNNRHGPNEASSNVRTSNTFCISALKDFILPKGILPNKDSLHLLAKVQRWKPSSRGYQKIRQNGVCSDIRDQRESRSPDMEVKAVKARWRHLSNEHS